MVAILQTKILKPPFFVLFIPLTCRVFHTSKYIVRGCDSTSCAVALSLMANILLLARALGLLATGLLVFRGSILLLLLGHSLLVNDFSSLGTVFLRGL